MDDLRVMQLEYEQESDARAQVEKLKSLIEGAHSGDVNLPRASALVARMYSDVKLHIEEAAAVKTRGMGGKYKGWLRAVDAEVVAVISIRECIRQCTSPETHVHVQDLCLEIGKLIELEVRIKQAEIVNPMYMQRIKDQIKDNATTSLGHIRRLYNVAIERVFKGAVQEGLNKTEMIQIGKFGVDACYEAGLIQQVRGVNRNGTTVSYILHPDVEEFVMGYGSNDVRNVMSKEDSKMFCCPDPWETLYDGGYITTRRKAIAPMMNYRKLRKSARPEVCEHFTMRNMPEVFDSLNYLQSIPFKVHGPTREAIERVWDSGGGVLGVPRKTPPVKPPNPLGEAWVKADGTEQELAIFNKWKRLVVRYYRDLREWKSAVREVGSFMRTSSTDKPIWFPMFVDSRERKYYRGIPNPQGSDLAKGVLHFHTKKPLGKEGVFWLKVHIANSYGFDKERFAVRAKWTEDNLGLIAAALDDPENRPEVFGDESPWVMFAAAWELREALKLRNPEEYCTGIPVHMDATCSGLQHFSAMLRDPIGGRYVNLIDVKDNGPKQDVYAAVAKQTMLMIANDASSADPDVALFAKFWMQVAISRKMAKKPVMTYVYGATLRGTADFIEELMEKEVLPELGIKWPDESLSFQYCMYAARKLFQGIAAAVPASEAAMQWLKSVARQMPNGKRMVWKTPSGFQVQHDYQDYVDKEVRLNSCGVTVAVVREWNEDTRPHSMQNAIAPNFVHSLDAAHLTKTSLNLKYQDVQMVSIHDSFGTHPCDVPKMHQAIREEFVKMYSGNVLSDFMWDVGGVGEPPMRGNLNLEFIKDSEFFFS